MTKARHPRPRFTLIRIAARACRPERERAESHDDRRSIDGHACSPGLRRGTTTRRRPGSPQYRGHPRRRPRLLRPRLLRWRDPHAEPRQARRGRIAIHASFTTRPAAGRRGRHCSRATTPSRSGATRCRACPAAARVNDRNGRRSYPRCSARWAIGRTTRGSGTSTGCRWPMDSITRTTSRMLAATSTRGSSLRTIRSSRPVKPGTGYYTTTAIADHGIKYLKEHAEKQPDQPFFLYLAFNSPHFPLQAPAGRHRPVPRSISRRLGGRPGGALEADSRAGPGQRPVSRMWSARSALPITSRRPSKRSALARSIVPFPGTHSPSDQRAFQAAKMEIHAAMVDRMDREIGRVLEQIRAMGAFENTLIFFMSDNGASAEIMVRDDGHDPTAPAGLGGHAPLPGAGLVDRGQHAVSPPQDLGARRGYRDAADRPLAQGHSPPAARSAMIPAM